MFDPILQRLRGQRDADDAEETPDLLPLLWWILALPALVQFYRLGDAIVGRAGYPFDLEWMEGQILHEALRISEGLSIYHAPSIDFIPPLYTPLYPALLAALGSVAGLSHLLGRAVSVACLAGLLYVIVSLARHREYGVSRRPAAVAATLAAAYIAAAYPWFRGWYDICRPDMLMSLLGFVGLVGLSRSALRRERQYWRPAVAGWGAVIAVSFFAKQTGLFFVAAGGAGLLLIDWRALPIYAASAGTVGLGGVGLLSAATDGWFWTYVYAYHQHHQTSYDRFVGGLAAPPARFPALYATLAVGTIGTLAERLLGDDRDRTDRALFWSVGVLVGLFAGGVGFATQWSYYNAYIPPLLFGVLGLVAALPPLFDALDRLPAWARAGLSLLIVGGLAVELGQQDWSPTEYEPEADDWRRGEALTERIDSFDGPVLAPMFPWYPTRTGKRPFVHQMGITDVTSAAPGDCRGRQGLKRWICPELDERAYRLRDLEGALSDQHFAGIVHSSKYDVTDRFDEYEFVEEIPPGDLPSQPTGYQFGGVRLWKPERPARLPEDARMLFDFESKQLEDWTLSGEAWGDGPTTGPLDFQQPVGGYSGDRFMNSIHRGDRGTGVARSPLFRLDGSTLHLQVGGGRDAEKVSVELRSPSGDTLRSATGRESEMLREVTWDVSDLRDRQVRLVLVDRSSAGWGHLLVDTVWLAP